MKIVVNLLLSLYYSHVKIGCSWKVADTTKANDDRNTTPADQTIESLNTREKRDNKPRFSIVLSVNIRGCLSVCTLLFLPPGGDVAVRNAFRLCLAAGGIIILLNGFFFFDVYPRYRYEDSTCWISAFAITANGTTRALYCRAG